MSALTRPSEFFTDVIAPAYSDYIGQPHNPGLALAAAGGINDQVECAFQFYHRKDRARLCSSGTVAVFRKLLLARCPSLQMMWDLSEGRNHRLLLRSDGPRREVGGAPGGGMELYVSGYQRPFLDGVTTAVKFWRNWPD